MKVFLAWVQITSPPAQLHCAHSPKARGNSQTATLPCPVSPHPPAQLHCASCTAPPLLLRGGIQQNSRLTLPSHLRGRVVIFGFHSFPYK
ncbi:MAG: hypothetical protein MUE81_23000 [Thermoflexibacter sp.]|nr:hypothetical protein [Thermoflexibacter sp.]